jgi:uncharacterized protein
MASSTGSKSKEGKGEDYGIIPGEWHVRYNYSVGKVAGRYFEGLKSRKIFATKCSKSNLTYLPPRAYCERSFAECDEWVEAGQEGIIEAATIVSAQFENLPKPPYCIAYVRLDGVSTAMVNFIKEFDMSDLKGAQQHIKPGTRVKVRWIEKPEGRATDFYYVL